MKSIVVIAAVDVQCTIYVQLFYGTGRPDVDVAGAGEGHRLRAPAGGGGEEAEVAGIVAVD